MVSWAVADQLSLPLAPGLSTVDYSVLRQDVWQNAISGLGTLRDKTQSTEFVLSAIISPEKCEWLFAQDDLARTIVSALVDDATRGGFTLRAKGEDAESRKERAEEIVQAIHDLDGLKILRKAALWGRCTGRGGVLLIVAGSGSPEEPLEPGRGELLDLVDLTRRELQPMTWYRDPTQRKFGTPEIYQVSPYGVGGSTQGTFQVHESRIVTFGGVDTPKYIRSYNQGCDLSALQAVYEVLKQVNGNWGSVCAMLADMSQAVVKLKGLIDSVAMGKEGDLQTRIALMDQMRSAVRAIVLDADGEEFEYTERAALSGVGDILDKTWERLAAASGTPVTRLFGISPGGLSGTDSTGQEYWYDRVRTYQTDILAPAILQLVAMLDTGDWEIVFPELEKMSPKEEAELRKSTADTDAVYVDKQILLPEEIAQVRFGAGSWKSGYDGIDVASREKMLAKELAKMEENAGAPDPAPVLPGQPGQAAPQEGGQPKPSEPKTPAA